jgi:hypothetical protein
MRTAVRLAGRTGDADREADARATLGGTLALSGRTRAGLEQLARAARSATSPEVRAKVLMRRSHIRYFVLADATGAVADVTAAVPALRSSGDGIWLARSLNVLGLAQMALGRTGPADEAMSEARALFEREGQLAESLVTLHNRGWFAFCRGDLPRSLSLYEEAASAYRAAGIMPTDLVFDQCEALVAAGLTLEAAELVAQQLEDPAVPSSLRADLLLVHASARLAVDEVGAAQSSALTALTLFRRQGRRPWVDRAELVELLALARSGTPAARLLRRTAAVAGRLEAAGSEESTVAWLLAGRLALTSGDPAAARMLARATAYRAHSSDVVRATAWHAQALQQDASGDRSGVLRACRRGLDALDAHRATLGSSELRALATRRGDELSALALRHAAAGGPRSMLEWSERWRAVALTQPPVRPPDDEGLARDLAALRDTRRRLAEARAAGGPTTEQLDEDRARLERAVRQRMHHLAGTSATTARFETERLVAALRGTTFVELVDVDGTLHALVVRERVVRHVVAGPTTAAEQAVAFARFALRQAARGRPADLGDVGRRLQEALLGDAARRLGDGPVVLSPPGRLHATPWALAPALADVPVSVVPSAALWLRATASAPSAGRRVLIAGPGLESGGAELDPLAERHPDAILLRAGAATVESSLRALDGAAIAHVAAHGHFRDDSPMFSSLDLDDGPLTVHDLERLEHAPHRIVLSACESGVVAPIGAGEMLGLVSVMLAMGSAGIVSSVATVNDRATAALMLDVHAALDDGLGLGEVLLRARQTRRGDRLHEATAAAFLAMGA